MPSPVSLGKIVSLGKKTPSIRQVLQLALVGGLVATGLFVSDKFETQGKEVDTLKQRVHDLEQHGDTYSSKNNP